MAKKKNEPVAPEATEVNNNIVLEVDLTKEHQTPTNNDVAVVEAANIEPAKDEPQKPVDDIKDTPTAVIDEPAANSPEPDENEMPMTSKELAKFAVGLINVGLSATMPKMYLNAEFNEFERDLILKMQAGEDMPDTAENSALMRRFMQYTKSLETVPLTDDETKMYTKNWEKCFDKWQFKMSPEAALITSSLIIVGGRLFPVITKKVQNIF